jgi:hypothetical protein
VRASRAEEGVLLGPVLGQEDLRETHISAQGFASSSDRLQTSHKAAQVVGQRVGGTHAGFVKQRTVVGEDILVRHELVHRGRHGVVLPMNGRGAWEKTYWRS